MRRLLLAAALLAAAPANAQRLRDLCPERPGLDTPPCTVDPGHVLLEIGLADWTLDRNAQMRTDTMLAGDALLRVGIADHAEAQIGWTPYGHVRMRDRATGAVANASGTGGVTLSVLRNLMHPDGSGTSIALKPYAVLPAGGHAIGAQDWGAGLLMPMSFELNGTLTLDLTPEADAAVDQDGEGRHLAYGSAIGLGVKISEAVSTTVEMEAIRDEDPSGHATQELAGLSLGWQPSDALQLDIGTNIGLNHATADVELYVGVSRRF